MNFHESPLAGVYVVEPKVFGDERGFFLESYNTQAFERAGLCTRWVQDNHSRSRQGVLRGLHFQNPSPQIKLVRVLKGAVLDVVVDIRPKSPTFGKHFSVELSEENKKMLYVPEGFAHGFSVLSESADFLYKCSDFYAPKHESGLLWNDPELGIDWKVQEPIVSAKDSQLLTLAQLKHLLTK